MNGRGDGRAAGVPGGSAAAQERCRRGAACEGGTHGRARGAAPGCAQPGGGGGAGDDGARAYARWQEDL